LKKIAFLLLASLSSCGGDGLISDSSPTKRSDSARIAFENWVKAAVGGDGIRTFAMLSDANKSGWLYDRLEEGDGSSRRWRQELQGTARTDLDLWLGVAKKHGGGRDEPLPSSVLLDKSLQDLFTEFFMRTQEGIRVQMSRLQIAQVYGDDSGVTVAVRNGVGATELYGMVYERDGWKIDAHRQPLSPNK
jgi:hypothetical protein